MSSGTPEQLADEQIVVARSGPLSGEVTVPGAKNSVLKLMAATLLADGEYELRNVPRILDVDIMADLLRSLGLRIDKLREQAVPGHGTNGQRLRIVNDGSKRSSMNSMAIGGGRSVRPSTLRVRNTPR